jgi:hypothetical protein
MTDIRTLGPLQSIAIKNFAWVTITVMLIDIETRVVIWTVHDVFLNDSTCWDLSTIDAAQEGNQYGFAIYPRGGDDTIQYNFTYMKNEATAWLHADGTTQDFKVSIETAAALQQDEAAA